MANYHGQLGNWNPIENCFPTTLMVPLVGLLIGTSNIVVGCSQPFIKLEWKGQLFLYYPTKVLACPYKLPKSNCNIYYDNKIQGKKKSDKVKAIGNLSRTMLKTHQELDDNILGTTKIQHPHPPPKGNHKHLVINKAYVGNWYLSLISHLVLSSISKSF